MKTDLRSTRPHILLVNPWIHDFAAFDFWLKPLGLLMLGAVLRDAGARVSFLDCLDRFHPCEDRDVQVDPDGRGPFRKTPIRPEDVLPPSAGPLPDLTGTFCRYGILPQWFRRDLAALSPRPDLILVTSIMTYWASGVAETIQEIRSVFPDVPVVLGGKYASLFTEHARTHSGADRVIPGHGEPALRDIVREFTGFDTGPIPAHSGANPGANPDDLPDPALDLCRRLTYAPIMTSRGCPYSCDYCASTFLEPALIRRSPERVFREISRWHREYGVENFAFYDDALLVDGPRYAHPLMRLIIDSGLKVKFHTPNALHIREIDAETADLMFRSGFKSVRMGLETTDFSKHRRHDIKVRSHEFTRAVRALKSAGFTSGQLGAYLLCGLPEQDLDDVAASIRQVKAAGIRPSLAYYTPIPHTPMWEAALAGARFDLNRHPFFTNNSLFPCVDSPDVIRKIAQLKNLAR